MKKLNFEKFTAIGGRFASNTISLNRVGGFSFNAGFFRKNNIEEFPNVVLFFAKRNGVDIIGFSFTKKKETGVLKLSRKGKTAAVRSNSFLQAYEINPKLYFGKYDPEEYEGQDSRKIFYITLRKNDER